MTTTKSKNVVKMPAKSALQKKFGNITFSALVEKVGEEQAMRSLQAIEEHADHVERMARLEQPYEVRLRNAVAYLERAIAA